MSNVVPFPTCRRVSAKAIPREEFEQLAELALDVVERIVALLDDQGEEAASFVSEHGIAADGLRSMRTQADRLSFETDS